MQAQIPQPVGARLNCSEDRTITLEQNRQGARARYSKTAKSIFPLSESLSALLCKYFTVQKNFNLTCVGQLDLENYRVWKWWEEYYEFLFVNAIKYE